MPTGNTRNGIFSFQVASDKLAVPFFKRTKMPFIDAFAFTEHKDDPTIVKDRPASGESVVIDPQIFSTLTDAVNRQQFDSGQQPDINGLCKYISSRKSID